MEHRKMELDIGSRPTETMAVHRSEKEKIPAKYRVARTVIIYGWPMVVAAAVILVCMAKFAAAVGLGVLMVGCGLLVGAQVPGRDSVWWSILIWSIGVVCILVGCVMMGR